MIRWVSKEKPLRKRTVDKVIEDEYWSGFFACLYGDESEEEGLEYASTSSLYRYNPIRRIAYRRGVRECLRVLNERVGKRRFRLRVGHKPEIPAQVYVEAYGEARIALKKSRDG